MDLNSVRNRIYFKDGTKKEYTLAELIQANLDVSTIESVSPLVVSYSKDSLSDNVVDVYKGDTIVLDTLKIGVNSGFWYSNAGNFMSENGYTKLIMHIKDENIQRLSYDVTFEKDGKIVSEKEHYAYTEEDLQGLTAEELLEMEQPYVDNNVDEGTVFIRYILSKGGVIV